MYVCIEIVVLRTWRTWQASFPGQYSQQRRKALFFLLLSHWSIWHMERFSFRPRKGPLEINQPLNLILLEKFSPAILLLFPVSLLYVGQIKWSIVQWDCENAGASAVGADGVCLEQRGKGIKLLILPGSSLARKAVAVWTGQEVYFLPHTCWAQPRQHPGAKVKGKHVKEMPLSVELFSGHQPQNPQLSFGVVRVHCW